MEEKTAGTLYIVATPIGNSQDMSPRGKKILSEVDIIAAEDTRRSMVLLNKLEIRNRLASNHKFNEYGKAKYFINEMLAGKSVAVITDAGTPCISDPGNELIKAAVEAGIRVVGVPGCCAAVSALTLSGLAGGRFAFEGFLSGSQGDKRRRLEEIKLDRITLIFYESPHRVQKTAALMSEVFGPRPVSIIKELTKINEQVVHTTLDRAPQFFDLVKPKGEYVLVVAGAPASQVRSEAFYADMTIAEHVAFYINSGLSKMEAMKAVSRDRGIPKGEVYKEMLEE